VELDSFHPSSIYTFFQSLAAALYVGGMLYFLRNNFSLIKRVALIAASAALVTPFASGISSLAGTSEGQSYFGALGAQIMGLVVFLKLSRSSASDRARVWKIFSILSGGIYALLRIGCHFRGCCWGRICPYAWATFYRSQDVVTPWLFLPLHPVQLYSAIHGVVLSFVVARYMRGPGLRYESVNPAHALGVFLILMGAGRLITDIFRADAAFYKQSWMGLYPNTVIAIAVLLSGAAIFLRSRQLLKSR